MCEFGVAWGHVCSKKSPQSGVKKVVYVGNKDFRVLMLAVVEKLHDS